MIATSKNKIVEVFAYAREVSIRHRHTRKYAKHLVALAIKQMMHLQLGNSQNSYQKLKSNDWLWVLYIFDTKKKKQWQEMAAERFF